MMGGPFDERWNRVTTKTAAMPAMDVAPRLPRLRERLGDASCDALAVTNLSNVGYLRVGSHVNNPRWNAYRSTGQWFGG